VDHDQGFKLDDFNIKQKVPKGTTVIVEPDFSSAVPRRARYNWVLRSSGASPRRKAIQRKTLSMLSRDIQSFGCHRRLVRNIGAAFAKCHFAQGHPVHLNLLAIRGSDVRTIAHASSGAESFSVGRLRLLEFFHACGATNPR
jgi:hypothetical protein